MSNNRFLYILMALGLSLFMILGCVEDEPTFPERTLKGEAKTTGTIQTLQTQGATTGVPKDINVYLPSGYDGSQSYPMILGLHGIGSDHTAFINYGMVKLIDVLIAEGTIQPTIFVFPDAVNNLGGGFYTNSVDIEPTRNPTLNPALGFGAYEALIISEVIPTIQAAFSIDANKMAVMGVSMGGYGAMKLAMLYPTMFKAVASLSGPLSFDELFFHEQSNLLDRVAMETRAADGSALPIIDINLASQNRTSHPITLAMLTLTSSFSPHFGSAATFDSYLLSVGAIADPTSVYQYMVSPTPVDTMGPGPADDIYPGVDLPVTIKTPGQDGEPVNSVLQKFLMHDCYTMLSTGKSYDQSDLDLDAFKEMHIYLDVGKQDDFNPIDDGLGFGVFFSSDPFAELLTSKGIDHVYFTYTGSHGSDYYYRFEPSILELNKALQ